MSIEEVFRKMLPVFMKEAGMNQVDLAKAVDKSEASVSLWLSGKSFPRINTIQKIADVLGCKTDDLLFESSTTKADVFADEKQTNEMLDCWYRLNSKNKKAVLDLTKALAESQEGEI